MPKDVQSFLDQLKSGRMALLENSLTRTISMSIEKTIFGKTFYKDFVGKYEEISKNIGVESLWPWGFSIGDLNAGEAI